MAQAVGDARVGGPEAEVLVAFADGGYDAGFRDVGKGRGAVDAEEDHGGVVCPGS